jgi:hypothetical protein
MIDVMSKTAMGLVEAAKRLPLGRRGKPATLSCILRWVLDGVKGPDGVKVKLEAVRLGGRWITDENSIRRFSERLTPVIDDPPAPTPQTAKRKKRNAERAGEVLSTMGA